MKQWLRSRNLWIALVVWGGFWPIAVLIPLDWLFDILNALAVSAGLAIVIVYWPGVQTTFLRNDLDARHYLVIAICGFAAASTARHFMNWIWRLYDKNPTILDSLFVAWLLWLSFTFALLHVTARNVVDGKFPRENFKPIAIVMGIAAGLSMLVIRFLEH